MSAHPFPRRIDTVHVESLGDELCVYDWQQKKVHTLNATAATVWNMCDGQTSPSEMAAELARRTEGLTPAQAEEVVWLTLKKLERAGLLQASVVKASGRRVLTRREMLATLGAVALALPTVHSIVAPSPIQAQSPVPPTATPVPTEAPPPPTPTATATATATATPAATATPTPAPRGIVLYSAGVQVAELGGRSGADLICQQVSNKPAGYGAYRAFISVNANDEIRDMPTNYGVPTNVPITSPNGTTIANNWADLLDGNIQKSLSAAGVIPAGSTWWSGSSSDGSVTANTCQEWMVAIPSAFGDYGCADATDASWINCETQPCNVENAHLLCIAYDPVVTT